MLGVISSYRACWASRRVGSGRSSKCYHGFSFDVYVVYGGFTCTVRTRVVWRTLESRGKSLTPESRMSMDESRSWIEDWREDTEEDREAAIIPMYPIPILYATWLYVLCMYSEG